MNQEGNKYKKVIDILRTSKPVLSQTGTIEKEVIERILHKRKSGTSISDIVDFLFGWIYIGWVRRSLITASVVLIMIFVYQQTIILKQINYLSSQTVIPGGDGNPGQSSIVGKQLLKYKFSNRSLQSKDLSLTDKQIKQLIESISELQGKYDDLLQIIYENPELRQYVEQKLNENSHTKIKL